MSRLPVRLRLTLVFALVMAFVLAGFGAYVYLRLEASLDEQLQETLTDRAETLAAAVGTGGALTNPQSLVGEDEFAQVVGPDGSLLAATPIVEAAPLLSPEALERARLEAVAVDRAAVAGSDGGEARLLAVPADRNGERLVVVVGASLEDRDDALDELLTQLLIAGPIVLVLASLAGYALTAAALRPVERMRERAAAISAETHGERLPLPPARDELFRLGDTLNAMLGRLEAGLARERRFVAEASHELRTPLALLQTELELALRRPRSPAELEGALRSAADEADRLARLAEDLLVLARADEGTLPLRPSQIPARDLLETVARRFSPRAAPAGRALSVYSPLGAVVTGDRLRLEQALGNLVDNALRHGEGTIRLEAERENGTVALRVSDEGTGLPDELLSIAFERFSRTDEARSHGSAGLGLAIVDAIARAHGGEVSAASRPEGGAEITIRLPAHAPIQPAVA